MRATATLTRRNFVMIGMIRDELAHMLAKEAGFTDYEASVPVTVFVNGEYHGLMWLHETYCDDYFKNKYGDGDGKFVILEGAESSKKFDGTPDEAEKAAVSDYNKMFKKYAYADLTDDDIYAELCKKVDVENYLMYYAYELYIGNGDWPGNNNRCYRYCAAEGEEYGKGVFDGRWRWLLHDLDNGLGMWSNATTLKYKTNHYKSVLNSSNKRYSQLFAALMKRQDCKEFFLNYTYQLIEGPMAYDNAKRVLDEMNEKRYTELMVYYYPYLAQLKKEGNKDIYASAGRYLYYYNQILDFLKYRPEYVLQQLEGIFK